MNDYNIKELDEKMEIHLIKSMKRNLSRHLKEESEVGFNYPQWQAIKLKELKKYQKENKDIIKSSVKGLDKEISGLLQRELRQGSLDAIKQYNKIHKRKLNPDKLMNKSFFRTNQRKVNNLIKVVNNDLNKVNTSALRMINDQYRQIIHKSAFFVGNGVMTEKQASEMAAAEIYSKKTTMQAIDEASKNFLSGGLNCIEYKDGRRVNIASYSDMAVRTASLRAHLMGEGDFRKSIGRTLVKVTTHGGACKICTAWQGKVLVDDVYSGGEPDGKHTLLSEAMAQGFLHPNCRHGLTTYYPELEEDDYIEDNNDDELQDKINYYERQEKKFDRLSSGSIDSVNRREYKQKRIACEMKKDILVLEQEMPYEDITNKILKQATPSNNEIPELFEFKKFNLKNANFDKKDITDIERLTLKSIQKKFGGQFNILHRVHIEGVRTPDAEYYNKLLHKTKRYYDVKAPNKSKSIKSKNNKISHQLYQAKGQTKNVIISLLRDDCDLTNIEAVNQITKCLNDERYSWLDSVILVGKNDYIKMYKKR